jgi:hypothetical protein
VTVRARQSARRTRKQRGQAMVEYSALNWVLIAGLALGLNAPVFRPFQGQSGGRSVIDLFLEAYQVYYDSFYFLLNLPIP